MKIKAIAIEPREYFVDLGVANIIEKIWDVDYGITLSLNINRRLKEYDVILSCIYHSSSAQILVNIAKSMNILSVFFSDGIGDWANFYKNIKKQLESQLLHHPIIHDFIYCCDKSTQRYLSYLGGKTILYRPDRMNSVRTEPKKNDFVIRKILFTTAKTPWFNEEEKKRFYKLASKLKSEIDNIGLQLEVRVFDEALYQELFLGLNNNKDALFEDVIKEFDCVISSPSSIISICAKLKRPVCLLDYRCTPMYVQGAVRYNGSIPFSSIIEEIEAHFNSLLMFQESQFYHEDEKSVLNTNEIVMKLNSINKKNQGVKIFFSIEYLKRWLYRKLK